jgi:acetyl esterase/lipase
VAPAAPKKVAPAKPKVLTGPKPTAADVPYGKDPRQVLDFWKAESAEPTPWVFFVHGGGWNGGDKDSVYGSGLADYLKAGISVVSIRYRLVPQAQAAGIQPPVKWPLTDAARALQFVRSKAKEWNLDKKRVGASGGSAGACTSLWLAFHADMADPKSDDPIARESTRLDCAAVMGAQTSLDPQQMKEWTPNSRYGGHAFGITGKDQFAEFLKNRERLLPWIKEYSPFELVTADDPPVYLVFNAPPALGQPAQDPTHSANFGVKLQEKLKSAGVECELVYPGAPNVKHRTAPEYLIARLKGDKKP